MVNISFVAAFVAGLLSFLNPCVLPLVPGFLGYLSGVSLLTPTKARLKIFLNSLFFVLGFSCIFAIFGVILNTFLKDISYEIKIWLTRIGGVIIVLFGLHLLGAIKIGWLEREHKLRLKTVFTPSYFLSFIFGAIFAIGWTPCVGAILGGVLILATTQPVSSFGLLLAYALGLGVPFLFVGALSSFAFRLIQRSVIILKYFNWFSGLFLVILGLVVLIGRQEPQFAKSVFINQPSYVKEEKYQKAKEFIAVHGYINTSNFALQSLIGRKVILLDFWTYSCINCQRSFPYLNSWYERYKAQGLEIIGVHSPEFDFEKDYDNVLAAVKKYNISYPVILDNEHANLRLYDTVYWPTEVLIDIDGFIVYKHIGEGAYEETEHKIQELLAERKKVIGQESSVVSEGVLNRPVEAVSVNFWEIGTPEIYFGSEMNRGFFGNQEGLSLGETIDYKLPSELKMNEVYFEGSWYNASDNLELVGDSGKIVLIYKAKSVNIVAGSEDLNIPIEIKIDGEKVGSADHGRDVSLDGVCLVDHFDLYNIISSQQYGRHKLEIEIKKKGVKVYAVTFG